MFFSPFYVHVHPKMECTLYEREGIEYEKTFL